MKKLLIALSALFILSSCDKEESFDTNTFPQKWELVSMTANGSTRTGNDMSYRETYVLNKDSTFVKTRIKIEIIETASGTFTIKKFDNNPYFVFKYASKNNFIADCNPMGLQEYLIIQSNSSITNNNGACDMHSLEYKRVE